MIIPPEGNYYWNLPYLKDPTLRCLISYQQGVFKVDGLRIYEFQRENGLLGISMPPSGLESLLNEIGEFPVEGKNLTLPTPPQVEFKFVTFEGVKNIVMLPDLYNKRPLLRYLSNKDVKEGKKMEDYPETENLGVQAHEPIRSDISVEKFNFFNFNPINWRKL